MLGNLHVRFGVGAGGQFPGPHHNTATGKRIHIKSPQRLRRAVTPKAAKHDEPAGQTPGEQGIAAARAQAKAANKKPDITPTVEIVTGQPLPADKAAAAKPKRVSMLDAAAEVMKAEAKPMHTKDIIDLMAARGLWTSPGGKTPHATLDAAMRREIKTKPDTARFAIASRGLFQAASN
jgi:hypothetical protein